MSFTAKKDKACANLGTVYQSVQAEESMVHADTSTKFLSSSHCMKLQWLLFLGPHTQ